MAHLAGGGVGRGHGEVDADDDSDEGMGRMDGALHTLPKGRKGEGMREESERRRLTQSRSSGPTAAAALGMAHCGKHAHRRGIAPHRGPGAALPRRFFRAFLSGRSHSGL